MFDNKIFKMFLILLIGVVIPIGVFFLFPDIVNDLQPFLGVDSMLKFMLILIGAVIYMYVCVVGTYKFPIIPLCVLFFYQIFQYLMNLYSPVTFNYRVFVLLFIIPVIFVVWRRDHFKRFLSPFLGLALFYLMNLIYTAINYAYSPNFLYNLNLYLQKRDPLLPSIYSVDLLIFLTFLMVGIYLTLNLVKNDNKKVNMQFSAVIAAFMFLAAAVSISGYIFSDSNFVEIVAGIKRLRGISSNSNLLAFFNICCSLYLTRFLTVLKSEPQKKFVRVTLFLIFVETILTFSRINILFLVLLHIFNFIILSKRRSETAFRIIFFSLLGGGIFFALDSVFSWGVLESIILRASDVQSNMFRPMVLEYMFSQVDFDSTVLFGHGIAAASNTLFNLFSTQYYISNLPIIYHPHNSYVHIFFDYGLVGLLFYFSTLLSVWFKALKITVASGFSNINSLILLELVSFSMMASLVDGYLFNFEVISFWIILSIMYVNMLNSEKGKNAFN